MMSFSAGFYGHSHGSKNVSGHHPNHTGPNAYGLSDINDHTGYEGQQELLLLERQRNQGLVLTLIQEIKKSVNNSMEGIVSGLRNEVTELRYELQCIKGSQPQTSCAPKHGRLPRVLLESF